MKKLILTILIMSGMQAYAGNDGGGGGGFCFSDGRCLTLAETGFRIEKTHDLQNPVLNSSLLQELDVLLNGLALARTYKLQIKALVLASSGTYKKVTSYDSLVLKKIRDEYESILKSKGISADSLVLYALSDKKNTYILPEFQKLNLRSQVLILAHEGIVRLTGSVVSAIKFDGAILDLLAGEHKQVEISEILSSFDEGDIASKRRSRTTLMFAYVEEYSRRNNTYLNLQELVPPSVSSRGYWNYCPTAEDEIKLYNNHRGLLEIMRKYQSYCFRTDFKKMSRQFSEYEGYGEVAAARAEGRKICRSIGNGSVVTPLDLIEYSYPNSGYVTTPYELIVFECQKQEVVSVYRMILD